MTSRIALGTAQFGLPYGIANQSGQVNRNEAAAILDAARTAGIDTLDTAIAYGESEQRLGEAGMGTWRVISKLPAMPQECADVSGWVRESVQGSLQRLQIPRLYGLLLHRPEQLLGPQGGALHGALAALREEGRIEKSGVSIYSPDELDVLWPRFRFDLVQAPFNVLDRRLAASGWLSRLHEAGTEIHTRSVFLQGLLLMENASRPATFKRWQVLWEEWHRWLAEQALTPLRACIGFVLAHPEIDRVVTGVDSLEQLKAVLACADAPAVTPPETLMSEDLNLINPSRWTVN